MLVLCVLPLAGVWSGFVCVCNGIINAYRFVFYYVLCTHSVLQTCMDARVHLCANEINQRNTNCFRQATERWSYLSSSDNKFHLIAQN